MPSTRKGATRLDQFSNFYKLIIGTSVADTIRAIPWVTGYTIQDKIAFVIHKIEVVIPGPARTLLNADGDSLYGGIATRSDLTQNTLIYGVDDSIVDSFEYGNNLATAVGFDSKEAKIVHDFTNEPGGGRIVAPRPLYIYVGSIGAGALIEAALKIVYTYLNVSSDGYRELWESMNPSA